MDNERINNEGRAEVKRRELYSLGLRIKGLRDAIREKLNPFDNIADIEAPMVSALAFELEALWVQHTELSRLIASIEKALGR